MKTKPTTNLRLRKIQPPCYGTDFFDFIDSTPVTNKLLKLYESDEQRKIARQYRRHRLTRYVIYRYARMLAVHVRQLVSADARQDLQIVLCGDYVYYTPRDLSDVYETLSPLDLLRYYVNYRLCSQHAQAYLPADYKLRLSDHDAIRCRAILSLMV